MHNLASLTLIALLAAVPVARGQSLTPGAACPPGGGSFCASSFSNIILSCSTNGTNGVLVAGNCNDNLAGVAPVGVKTDAICGNSTSNNAACFLPPYPAFITSPVSSSSASSSAGSTTSTLTVTSTTSSITVITPPGNGTTTITTSVGPTGTPTPTTSTPAPTTTTSSVPVFTSGVDAMLVPMAMAWGVAVAMVFGLFM